MTRLADVNWDRLRREASEAYERSGEGRRRREAGSRATEDAERLAWWVRHRPDDEPIPVLPGVGDEAQRLALALAADQAVYVYCRGILLAKMPPSTMWTMEEVPGQGMRLTVVLWSIARQQYVGPPEAPTWEPGEWTFCGRGHEGQ